MALGCGMALCKYILFFFNFLIFVCGTCILGIGVWLVVDKSSVMSLLKISQSASESADLENVNQTTVLEQLAYILIAIGVIVVLLGFFGCCGAAYESKGLLIAYVVLVMVMIGLEIGGGVYAGVAKDDFKIKLKGLAKTSLTHFKNESSTDAVTLAWKYVFAEFECCGIDGAADLIGSDWDKKKSEKQKLPVACCKLQGDKNKFVPVDPMCPTIDPKVQRDYQQSYAHKGCYKPVEKWFDDHFGIIIGVSVGVCLIEFFGVVIACCICCAIGQLAKEY